MLGILIALLVMVVTGYLILTKAKPQVVLVASGIFLMAMGSYLGYGEIFPQGKGSLGLVCLDIFEKIRTILVSRIGGLGLQIMAVGGYARYMDTTGASRAMVQVLSQPLNYLKSPYLVLAGTYVLGQFMGQFITSASGLGMLLMVTLYPTLVRTGVSRLSAVAVIGTTTSIEWGISESNTILAAQVANMPVAEYFLNYQVTVGCTVILAIAVAHFFTQRWFDSRMMPEENVTLEENVLELPPLYYAIFPTLPLTLVVAFLAFSGKNVNLVTVIFICLTVTMAVDFFRTHKLRETFASIQSFFDGMGSQFANVITLIVAGETFAQGLVTIGAVNAAISGAQSSGFGGIGILIIMVLIIAGCAILMGSGNAPFFAFASLIPNIATAMNISPVAMIMPMHFATSIARGMSPITAVIAVTSGMAGVSPFDVVKRTVIPLSVGMIVNLAVTIFLFY